MTLVVGHASTEIGFLVGDTLLTPRMNIEGNPKGPFNGEFHALKVQILDPRTAVGFATTNDATTALEIISATYQVLRANSNIDVCECLFKAYQDEIKRSERDGRELPDCDFLVLKIAVGVKRLWLITKEGIQERERAYIGDATEYKNLNSLRRPYCYPEFENVQQPNGSFVTRPLVVSAGEIEFQEVSLAMETLVQQRRSSSVGAIAGCVLRVVDARRSGELEYLQLGEAGLSPAEGRTGLSLLASNEGERGIGIYFTTGRIGFVLIVGDSDLCRRVEASLDCRTKNTD